MFSILSEMFPRPLANSDLGMRSNTSVEDPLFSLAGGGSGSGRANTFLRADVGDGPLRMRDRGDLVRCFFGNEFLEWVRMQVQILARRM